MTTQDEQLVVIDWTEVKIFESFLVDFDYLPLAWTLCKIINRSLLYRGDLLPGFIDTSNNVDELSEDAAGMSGSVFPQDLAQLPLLFYDVISFDKGTADAASLENVSVLVLTHCAFFELCPVSS